MDEERKRIRRPKLPRTAPIREFSTFLMDSPYSSSPPGDGRRRGNDRHNGAGDDVLQKSVSIGYSVIQEQIHRARRLAQQMTPGLREAGEPADDITQIFRRMMRFSTDFGSLLADVTEMMTRGSSQRAYGGASAGGGSEASSAASSRICVEIETRLRSRVTLDLGTRASKDGLLVPGLYPLDGEGPPLARIAFADGALRIEIPDDQPPGTYTGAVIDPTTREPCGTLSVRLGP